MADRTDIGGLPSITRRLHHTRHPSLVAITAKKVIARCGATSRETTLGTDDLNITRAQMTAVIGLKSRALLGVTCCCNL